MPDWQVEEELTMPLDGTAVAAAKAALSHGPAAPGVASHVICEVPVGISDIRQAEHD